VHAPLPGYGNLAPAYAGPTWHAPLAQAQYAETRAADRAARYAARANRANAPPQQLKKKIMNTFQLFLVVSYSDAGASSPGFTLTHSIFIGR